MSKIPLVIFLISTLGKCLSQDTAKTKPYVYQGITKNECKKIINDRIHFLTGTWNFVRADFRDTNLRLPIENHSLTFIKNKFQVNSNSNSTPTQTGKIKITKDKTEIFEFCYPLLWFRNQNKPFPDDENFDSNEAFELPKYYLFYLVTKCDKDSLVIYTPVTSEFKSIKAKHGDQIIKRYVRQK